MNPFRRVAPSVATATVVVAVTAVGASRGVADWELNWAQGVVDWEGVTGLLEVLMQSGSRAAIVVAVALAAVLGARQVAWSIGVAGVLAWAAAEVGKELVGRPRPDASLFDDGVRTMVEGFGYPSSHTAIATAIAVAVVWRYPRRGWLIMILPIATAAARVHIGAHWPLDVIGGAAIGVIAAGLATAAVDRTDPRPWPEPVVAPVGGTAARTPSTVRVATFNIRNGRALLDGRHLWWLRRSLTARAMLDLDADVIGVQEAFRFQVRTLARVLPGYQWVGGGRTSGGRRGEHCAVLWRADRFDLASTTTRWFGEAPDTPGARLPGAQFPRVVTVARLVPTTGRGQLAVANTHLDSASAEHRVRSASQLVEWVDSAEPGVIVGDLNSEPDSEPLRVFADHGWVRVRPRGTDPDGEPVTSHEYEPESGGTVIDHILVSPDLEVLGGEVWAATDPQRLPSDHWPVTADFRLPRFSVPD